MNMEINYDYSLIPIYGIIRFRLIEKPINYGQIKTVPFAIAFRSTEELQENSIGIESLKNLKKQLSVNLQFSNISNEIWTLLKEVLVFLIAITCEKR